MDTNNNYTSNAGYFINGGYMTNGGYIIAMKGTTREIPAKSAPVDCTTTTSTISCTNQNLTANALSGNNGLLSLNLIQWTALLLLVLTIITLWKRAYPGKTEKKEEHSSFAPQA